MTKRIRLAGAGVLVCALLTQARAGETVVCAGTFAGADRLSRPAAVATDARGKAYVLDRKDHAVKVFNSAGALLSDLRLGKEIIPAPWRIGVSRDGARIYLTDWHSHVVVGVDASGTLRHRWGGRGHIDGRFMFPGTLVVDADGNVFVADRGRKRVQKFTSEGKRLKTFLIRDPSKNRLDSKHLGVVGLGVWRDGSVSSLLRHDELGLGMIYTLDATGVQQSRTSHWHIPEPTCMVALGRDRMLAGAANGDVMLINDRTKYGRTWHLRKDVGTIFDMALLGTGTLLTVDERGRRVMRCRITVE